MALLARTPACSLANQRRSLAPAAPGRLAPARAHTADHWPASADAPAAAQSIALTRRCFFAAAAAPAPAAAPAGGAAGAEWGKFTGYAVQPDLYLGQGYSRPMNYDEPRYTFEYPVAWEEEPVSKTDKSTMGMDGLVRDPKSRRTRAFVIALGGKDYAMARLVDSKMAIQAMAGGDPDLREAISNAGSMKATKEMIDGVETYCYDIDGDRAHYLAKVAIKDQTVYGLFVVTPAAAWAANQGGMRRVYDTFTLL